MKSRRHSCAAKRLTLLLCFLALASLGHALDDALAKTPPMGYVSPST